MTILFSEDWASGTIAAWSQIDGTPMVVTSPVHHGSYAVALDQSLVQTDMFKIMALGQDTYLRAYVNFSAILPNSHHEFIQLKNSSYVDAVWGALHVNTDGTTAWYLGSPTAEAFAPTVVNANQWYCVEIRRKVGAGNGISTMWVDGVQVLTNIADTITGDTGMAEIGGFRVGVWSRDYFDCIAAADSYTGPEGATTTIQLNVVAGMGGTVSPSGLLTLTIGASYQFTATPSSGYTFNHWDLAGQNISTTPSLILPTTATMNGQTLTAVFNAQLNGYLSVSALAGTTPIIASVTADGQSSTTPITFSFPAGTYTITATYQGQTLPSQTVSVVAGQTTSVTLNFPTPTITLNVSTSGNGNVSPSGPQILTIGQSYQFVATPNTGYVFDHWDLGGTNLGNTPSLIITASADMNGKTLTAIFIIQQVTLNIATNGNGTVNYTNGPQIFNAGASITFTATPATNNVFNQWTLNGITYTANPLSMQIVSSMNGKTLTAYFAVATVILSVVAATNGIVSPSGIQTLMIGQSYQFSAIPNSGYQLDHWDLSGQSQGSSNPIAVTVSASMNGKTLTALFILIPPRQITLNIATSGNGNVNLSIGQHIFNVGDRVTFTATPATNNAFSQWILNGTFYTANPATIQITDDMNGQTLTALFVLTAINLSVISGANGSVVPSGNMVFTIAQSYLFNATASVGYTVDHWDLGGVSKGSTNPLALTATEDMDGKTLTALFTVIPPTPVTVTVAVLGNGTTDLTPGTHEFHVGDTITIAAIPSAGTAFKRWQLDGVSYTDNPLSLPVTESLNGQTLTAEFESIGPISAGFPIWVVVPTAIILIGAYALSRRGKNHRG